MKKFLLFLLFILINFSAECRTFEHTLKPKKIGATPGEKIEFKVILKNFKENKIVPPDELWILEKKETIENRNLKEITYSLTIPSNASANIYKIESIAKAEKKIDKNYLIVSIPYRCEKTQNPPTISESSCSPCYWGYKRSARFDRLIFYSLYDEKNLYFAIQVKDEDISSKDRVEIYFYIKNRKYTLLFSPSGIYEGKIKIDWIKKVVGTIDDSKDTDNSYWIVASVPLNSLGIIPGERIKINIVNFDNKKEKEVKFWSNLTTTLKDLENSELFVDFIFAD